MTKPILAILLLLPLSVSAGASAQTTSLLCVSASGFVDGTPISNPEGKKFAVTVLKIGGETLVEGFGNAEVMDADDLEYSFSRETEAGLQKMIAIDRHDLTFFYFTRTTNNSSVQFEGQCEILSEPKI